MPIYWISYGETALTLVVFIIFEFLGLIFILDFVSNKLFLLDFRVFPNFFGLECLVFCSLFRVSSSIDFKAKVEEFLKVNLEDGLVDPITGLAIRLFSLLLGECEDCFKSKSLNLTEFLRFLKEFVLAIVTNPDFPLVVVALLTNSYRFDNSRWSLEIDLRRLFFMSSIVSSV